MYIFLEYAITFVISEYLYEVVVSHFIMFIARHNLQFDFVKKYSSYSLDLVVANFAV